MSILLPSFSEQPRTSGPKEAAVDAELICGKDPDGWNVVRENEYLPSIGSDD